MFVRGRIGGQQIWLVIPGIKGRDLQYGIIYLTPKLTPHFRRAFNHLLTSGAFTRQINEEIVWERPFAHHLSSTTRVLTTNQFRAGADGFDLLYQLLQRPSFQLEVVDFCVLRHTNPDDRQNPKAWETDPVYCFSQMGEVRAILNGRIPLAELQAGATQSTIFDRERNPTQALVTLQSPILPHRAPGHIQDEVKDYVHQLASEGEKLGFGNVTLEEFMRKFALQEYTSGPNAEPMEGYYPPDFFYVDAPFTFFGGGMEEGTSPDSDQDVLTQKEGSKTSTRRRRPV
jgi:hypothetical protein